VSENLALVRSIFTDLERGDFSRADWADPEIECVLVDGPDPGRFTGLAGLAEARHGFSSVSKDLRTQVEEYRELDGERVLVLVGFRGRGRTNGLEVGELRVSVATIYHVAGGKVTRIVNYFDRDRALADLGLRPEGDAA
jgi:ketosteroid isomerase-like protein